MRLVRSLLPALLLCLAASDAAADRVVTTDGRVLEPKKAREDGAGYVLTFEHGEVRLPDRALVKAVEIEGDMSDYVPANEDERRKLEQGFVRLEGKWLSKPAYQDLLRKRHEASRARAEELARHASFGNAWKKETKHFAIESNTSPELIDYYAELLESYYDLMDDRFKIKPGPELRRTKMRVCIYKNRPEFTRIAGVPSGVAGFFNGYTRELQFYHDYQEPAISEWVALHEGTHLLTYLIDPQYVPQIWLNEAVADYFGSATVERDKKGKLAIHSGRLQTDRVLTVQQAIQDGDDVSLERLFALTKAEFSAFEYAHAWSFIYFLNNSSTKNQKAFDKFFKDIYTLAKGIDFEIVNHWDKSGRGKQVPANEIRRVVLGALGVDDVEQLDREWKAFIAQIPVEGPEARFKRAYRAIALGLGFVEDEEKTKANIDSALADVDAALEGGLDDPRAWWLRSRLRTLTGDRASAQKDLAKAVELDPLNAAYRFESGIYLIAEDLVFGGASMSAGEDGLGTHATCPEAKPFLGLATELAPDNDHYRETYERYLGG